MRYLYTIGIIFIFQACGNIDSVPPFDNLNGNTVGVIGHGGNGFQSIFDPFNPLPSNSEGSISDALEIDGLKGVEIDVQLSADSVLIAFHDYKLSDMTDLSGCIAEKNSTEILNQPYRNGLGIFHSEKIISFEKVIEMIASSKEIELHIDAKLQNQCSENEAYLKYRSFFNSLLHLLNKKNFPLGRILLISEYEPFLDYALGKISDLRVVKDGPGISPAEAENYRRKNYFGVSVDANHIEREKVNMFHDHNLRVILFGGKSRSGLIRSLGKNPDYIQTNNPSRLAGLVNDLKDIYAN